MQISINHLTESRIRAFNWYKNWWNFDWCNCRFLHYFTEFGSFGGQLHQSSWR